MDPFTLLKNDHQKVSKLFEQIESADNEEDRKSLFMTLKQELLSHAEVEEKYFYPVLEKKKEDVELEEHALDEHAHVKQQIAEIEEVEDEEKWLSLVKKLKEEISHHVEEEESEIFPEVRDILDEKTLRELGSTLEKEKERCLKDLQDES